MRLVYPKIRSGSLTKFLYEMFILAIFVEYKKTHFRDDAGGKVESKLGLSLPYTK